MNPKIKNIIWHSCSTGCSYFSQTKNDDRHRSDFDGRRTLFHFSTIQYMHETGVITFVYSCQTANKPFLLNFTHKKKILTVFLSFTIFGMLNLASCRNYFLTVSTQFILSSITCLKNALTICVTSIALILLYSEISHLCPFNFKLITG